MTHGVCGLRIKIFYQKLIICCDICTVFQRGPVQWHRNLKVTKQVTTSFTFLRGPIYKILRSSYDKNKIYLRKDYRNTVLRHSSRYKLVMITVR